MPLEELRKKIYKPEAEFEERPETPEIFRSGELREKREAERWRMAEKKRMPPKKKKYLTIGITFAVIVFLTISGLLIWRGLTSFNEDKVKLTISGPEKTISGDEIVYTVRYKNDTRLDLTNLKLVFYYPENSISDTIEDSIQTIDLPDLVRGQEKRVELPVRLIGLKGEVKQARAELSYQPSAITTRYIAKADFLTTIISVPLALDFDLPEKLVGGQGVGLSLNYLNQTEVSFDDIQIQIEYPSGFVFQSSFPKPTEDNNIWELGHIMAGQEGKIDIQGFIEGKEESVKTFKAKLGTIKDNKFVAYAEAIDSLKISTSPLFVSQTLNGSVDTVAYAGQTLTYIISYENTADVGIEEVVITSQLQGDALDMTKIKLDKGSFNGETNLITWKASNLPSLKYLAPHQKGQVAFSVNIRDVLPAANPSDKNFTVVNNVEIDTLKIPSALKDIQLTGQSRLETKIASQITFQTRGLFNDNVFSNSGPIPPRIGQTTTYTLKWQLANAGNDLTGVEVSAYLPPHVKWLGNVSPGGENISYNSQTGYVVWKAGSVPALTGFILPAKQIAFQISITPGQAHLGGLMELIGQSTLTAYDDFVDLQLKDTASEIDTDLPHDPTIGLQEGRVTQ